MDEDLQRKTIKYERRTITRTTTTAKMNTTMKAATTTVTVITTGWKTIETINFDSKKDTKQTFVYRRMGSSVLLTCDHIL